MNDLSKPLLLLVDDVPANLHVLVAALRNDFRIKTATSGASALELAWRPERPDLILLDVMMPEMNGIEVLRRLRQDRRSNDIPVIFVSADISEQSQLEGLELGADDYLIKPVVPTLLLARVRNLLQRKQAEAQLRLAAHVFEHSGEAIIITDRANRIINVNPSFTRITGYSLDEVRGRDPKLLASGRTTREEYGVMWETLLSRGFWQGEMWDRHKDGGVYPKLITISVVRNARGEVDFHIASFTNIAEQKAAEARIHHIAHHDALTGLPNRLHLQAALERSLALARREGQQLALMFIDLDRFKVVNDTLGHTVGDGLLVEVARRLRESCRESDFVARLGGDEFVVAVAGADAARAAARLGAKLLKRLSQPYRIAGHDIQSSPSIGVAVYPEDGDGMEALMKNADVAMYRAKSAGRNTMHFFHGERNDVSAAYRAIGGRLERVAQSGELRLQYQPQVRAVDGAIAGLEALVRWATPERMMLPEEFIGAAEESGTMAEIGDWIFDSVCAQVARWQRAGRDPVRVSINLSASQLLQPGLVAGMAAALERHGVDAGAIEVEIPEEAAISDPDQTLPVMAAIHALGIGLALDGFGSASASLARLRSLPVQRVKLDRRLVQGLQDPDVAAVCAAAVAVSRAMGWRVVAQGIESETEREYLRGLGCEVMQGYLFARPVAADELEGSLAALALPA